MKKTNNISIIIDNFDDIFSDFDPRSIDKKALSIDFINELKQRCNENNGIIDSVSIAIPKKFKDPAKNRIVIQRIKQFFERKEIKKYNNILRIRQRGIIFLTVGISILAACVFRPTSNEIISKILEILMVPGWFGIWEGLSKIFDYPANLKEEEIIYWKLSQVPYKFEYYENI